MTFDSTRMRENPGKVFDVVTCHGSVRKAKWIGLGGKADIVWMNGLGDAYLTDANGVDRNGSKLIVKYAPRSREGWMLAHSDGELFGNVSETKEEARCHTLPNHEPVRVRIEVLEDADD